MGSFGAEVRFNRVPEKVCEALVQSQNRICGRLIHGNHAEVFPALGLAARFRTICKHKTLRLLGIPQKLIAFSCVYFLSSISTLFFGFVDGDFLH